MFRSIREFGVTLLGAPSLHGRSGVTSNKKEHYMAQQNLFIGSLAYATTDDSLKQFFEAIGPVVSARVIMDRESGRSKGFGFVEFENDEDNQKAVDQLNGKELDGRSITVGLARPREERPKRDFGGNGGGSFRQRSW
jgi:RNA recognition motif-containing protein